MKPHLSGVIWMVYPWSKKVKIQLPSAKFGKFSHQLQCIDANIRGNFMLVASTPAIAQGKNWNQPKER